MGTTMQKYVTIDDIEFVENKIKKLNYYPTPNELWKEMKGRFKIKAELGTIIEYFLNENKIILDRRDGTIVWIDNPKLTNLLQKRGFVVL